jgi:RNA polymerase sigma-70 factor (ECF subfamily)
MSLPPDATSPSGDEPQVVARARGGDVAAFELLYRATAGRVFALCLRMSGDRDRARELAHDVFVRAWEKLPGFRGDASFATWLHRLAVNEVLEQARGERRRLARVSLAGDEDEGAVERRAPAAAGDPDARIDLERAIALLPPNARRVFVLHDVDGYRHGEIARAMAIAEGTVRAHLHRARRLLMEMLER